MLGELILTTKWGFWAPANSAPKNSGNQECTLPSPEGHDLNQHIRDYSENYQKNSGLTLHEREGAGRGF